MKALLFLFLALPALGRDVTFAWDANPPAENVTAYRIEVLSPAGEWESVGSTTAMTLDVVGFPDVETHVRAIAMNAVGLESAPSDVLIVPPTPTAPAGLRITLTPKP